MTRTLESLLDDARDALIRAGLSDLDWTRAQVDMARSTRSGLIVGELGWGSERIRFVTVNRSAVYRLVQHGASWEPGLVGEFWIRLVIHRRFGFQAEIHDVDVRSLGGGA